MTEKALTRLVSMKGFPAQVKPTIEEVHATENLPPGERWTTLWNRLGPRLQQLSLKARRPQVENLISAQGLPTAARLGLIEGRRTIWQLTYNGRRLFDVAPDNERFRLRLGRVIWEKDQASWHILESLKNAQSHPGAQVTFAELALELAKAGIDSMEGFKGYPPDIQRRLAEAGVTVGGGSTRLSDLLQFYDWVDLVRSGRGTVTLSPARIEDVRAVELESPRGSISLREFGQSLSKHYQTLSKKVYRSPFVPIKPGLMAGVCEDLHIGEGQFTELLSKVPTMFGSSQVLLSQYRHRRDPLDVVVIGGRQYYYLSMYPVSGQREASP